MNASDVIARLRELRAKATAGKFLALPDTPKADCYWRVSDGEDFVCQLFSGHGEFENAKANAAAIVAAMNSLEPLLDAVDALIELQDIVSRNGLAHSKKARAALAALAEGGGE